MRHQLKKGIGISFKQFKIHPKLSFEEKARLYENLSALLQSGIPIIKILDILSSQNHKSQLFTNIKEGLLSGNSLKDSMKETLYFDELSLALVEVGEKTGELENAFDRLSEYYHHLDETYKDVRSASYYPFFIIFMILFLFGFIIFYFLPNIISLYGGEVPQIGGWTQILIEGCLFIKEYIFAIIISLATIIILLIQLPIMIKKPLFFTQLKYKIPLLGDLIYKQNINNIIWELQIMLGSGVNILNALDIIEKSTQDLLVSNKLSMIQESIIKGNSLYESIQQAGLKEDNLLYFINIGEESGDLENRLKHLTKLYTQEIKRRTKELTSLAQPIFITVITMIIGIAMLTIIMPLLDFDLLYNL